MRSLATFHLYHHVPDPLAPEQIHETCWLGPNALSYSLVAIIKAQNHQEALTTAQQKATGQTLPRAAEIQTGNLLRETVPGDVLVSSRSAWMVQPNGTFHVCSSASSTPSRWLKQKDTTSCLSWSPDGALVLAAEHNRRITIHAWDQNQSHPNSYTRSEHATTVVAWSPRGERAASGGYHGEVHLWTPDPWRTEGHRGSVLVCCTEEPRWPRWPITSLAWFSDGTRIAAGRTDGQIVQWDARTGNACQHWPRHTKTVTALAFAPTREHWLLSASEDTLVRLWDVQTNQEVQQYEHQAAVTAAVWSPESRIVASCERNDAAIHLWDPRTGQLLERLPLAVSTTQPPTVLALAWSPDGRWLATGCDDGTIQVFASATSRWARCYRAGSEGSGEISALAWSPDGQYLASAGTGYNGYNMDTKIWAIQRDLEATSTAAIPVE